MHKEIYHLNKDGSVFWCGKELGDGWQHCIPSNTPICISCHIAKTQDDIRLLKAAIKRKEEKLKRLALGHSQELFDGYVGVE